jgi:acetyl esterase
LRDEGAAYAAVLSVAGVPTRHYQGEGLIHGYFGLGEASEAARIEAQKARADFRVLLQRGV